MLKDILLKDRQYTIRLEVLEVVSELFDRRLLGAESRRPSGACPRPPHKGDGPPDVELRLTDATTTIERRH